jgi:hypothetical protein
MPTVLCAVPPGNVTTILYIFLINSSKQIRRVKCGEEKPSCKRCTSTGRTCDGYIEQIPRNQIKKSRSPEINSCPGLTNYIPCSDIPGDAKERHSFYYFRTKTVGDITGIFASEFWNRLVLTVSHSEPTVRHALLALSSIHESYELRRLQDSLNLVQRNEFAMQQYSMYLSAGTCYNLLRSISNTFQYFNFHKSF